MPVHQPQVDPYDYSGDPLLQRIKAMGAQRLAEAQAAAIRARQVAESDYGGVQARLGRERVERPRALVAGLSRQNLGYSSEGANQQTGLARSMAEEAADEQRRYQERLSGIEQGVADIGREVSERDIGAEEEAAARLQERLGDLRFQRPQGRQIGGPVARALRGRLPGLGGGPAPAPRPTARILAGRRPRAYQPGYRP